MIEEQPLWAPGEDAIATSNLTRFMHFLARHYGAYLANSRDLHAFSVRVPEVFWPALWDFCGVRGDKGSPPYLIDGDKLPGARFFPDARLNFAENMLARPNQGDAIVFWSEDKVKRRMSWDELNALVSRLQQFFAAHGVGVGDRVAAMLPNMPGSAGGDARGHLARRHLVVLLARFRRAGRARPVRPDRAQAVSRLRRLLL